MAAKTEARTETQSLPTLDEVLDSARHLRPRLEASAADTEEKGRVSAEITALMKEAQLLRLGQPARFGGTALPPSAMLRLGFELGRGCGSTAWCAMIANMCAVHASSWPLQAQEDVWSVHPENLVCGVIVPTGKCSPAPGGFKIQGQWPYASNCDNSDWIFVAARFPETAGAPPDTGVFLLPRSDYKIDHDSWQVAGMQGTGSKTLIIAEPVFVPEHRFVRFADMAAGTTPGRSVAGNFLTNFPFATFSAVALVAPMLGMAQGSLDCFTRTMREKVLRPLGPGPIKIASQTFPAQVSAGEASATIDSAMGLLLHHLLSAETKILGGADLTVAERIDVRRAIGFASRQACTAVNTLLEAAGSSAAALSSPIQRHWRDVNVAARHVNLDVDGIYALVGQQRFGLDPAGAY